MQSSSLIFGVPGVKNLAKLNANLLRSAQPTLLGYRALKNLLGVSTTINLDTDKMIEDVRALGLSFVYNPLVTYDTLPPDELDHLVTNIWNLSREEVVHFNCMQGCDRTGTVAAAIRLKYFEWGVTDAIEERDRMGFHSVWWGAWLNPTIEGYVEFLKKGGRYGAIRKDDGISA